MRKLFIRADASSSIGHGHIMRNLGIAETWIRKGGRAAFLCEEIPLHLAERAALSGAQIRTGSFSHNEIIRTCSSEQVSAVILDGYHFASDFIAGLWSALRREGITFVVFDDSPTAKVQPADISLNPNLYVPAQKCIVGENQMVLSGPEFIPLREEILRIKKIDRSSESLQRILIAPGGTRCTPFLLRLAPLIAELSSSTTQLRVLSRLKKDEAGTLSVLLATRGASAEIMDLQLSMASHYQWADAIITSAGASSLEAAFLDMPALVFTLSDSQIPQSRFLQQNDLAICPGFPNDLSQEAICDALRSFLKGSSRSRTTKRHKLIDGRGCERIVEQILMIQ